MKGSINSTRSLRFSSGSRASRLCSRKRSEQEIKDQPVVGSLASIGERLDKLDKVLTVLERIEGRQIVVKKEIEQEIKDQPVVGSFARV